MTEASGRGLVEVEAARNTIVGYGGRSQTALHEVRAFCYPFRVWPEADSEGAAHGR